MFLDVVLTILALFIVYIALGNVQKNKQVSGADALVIVVALVAIPAIWIL